MGASKLKSIIPWIALAAAVLAAATAAIWWPQRRDMLIDTGETRPVVDAALDRITDRKPGSIDEPQLLESIRKLQDTQHIASIWLFSEDGTLVYSSKMVPRDGAAEERATLETRQLLESIPEDALTTSQRTLILAASAIRSEGEHNDVYRHMVREIRSAGGGLLGWIGAAYDINPAIDGPGLRWIVSILAWLFFMGVYWLSLPLYVWLDARERGEKAGIWAVFVLIGNLVALLAYLLVRPRKAD
jgi:hypothetical protein